MKKAVKKKIVAAVAFASACVLSASIVAAYGERNVVAGNLTDNVAAVAVENVEMDGGYKKTTKSFVQEKSNEEVAYTEGLSYNYVVITDDKDEIVDKYYVLRSIGTSKSVDIIIPSEIDLVDAFGKVVSSIPVREIHPFAFKGNTDIKSVVIPETVEVIGADAFKGCTSLEKVEMPKNLGVRVYGDEDKANKGKLLDGTIERGAFAYCGALTEIKIPSNVKAIADDTFNMCAALEKVTLHKDITAIGRNAFARCSSLMAIKIPEKVAMISDGAFHYCTALETVEFSENVTRIGKRAFAGCSSLTEVKLPNPSAKDATLTVDKYAFAYCDNLESVSVSEKTESIANYAFAACKNLKEFKVAKKNAVYQAIDGDLYTKEQKTLMQYALGKTDKDVVIDSDVLVIADGAFATANNIESVTFEYEVIYEENAQGEKVKVDVDGVKVIGDNAFFGCEKLASVALCDGLMAIGEGAFRNCNALETVVIVIPQAPDVFDVSEDKKVMDMNIYNFAFRWCENLEKVYVKGDYKSWKLKVNLGILTGMEDVEVYYYSEEFKDNHWYYEDGVPTVWVPDAPDDMPEWIPDENA